METTTDRPRRFTARQLRIVAWVCGGLLAAGSLWYVQDIAEEAHDTATTVDSREKKEDAEEEQERLDNCLVRNRAVSNGRDRFIQFNENLTAIFQGGTIEDPQAAADFQKRLFKGINLDPAAEDLDCNGDGELSEADYAP